MFDLILRRLLFLLPPDKAHHLVLRLLHLLPFCLLKRLYQKRFNDPIVIWGLTFANRVGLSAGFDKSGDCIDALLAMGFGFVELGGVTPLPQSGNPRPHLTRIDEKEAIINRCGLNNKGVDYLVERLKQRKLAGIVGVNIAPNTNTPKEKMVCDYLICLQKLYPYADYLTMNISCPNAGDLSGWQQDKTLDDLLDILIKERTLLSQHYGILRPLLVKISPDLDKNTIQMMADLFLKHQIDGVVATNTSKRRHGVEHFPEAQLKGGLSGRPIRALSQFVIEQFAKATEWQLPIIAVGGIDSADQAKQCLNVGASLVEIYSGLIFKGYPLIRSIAKAISQ